MRSMKLAILLCLLAGMQLAGAQLEDDYQDAVTEGIKIVYAEPSSNPVGFEATQKSIVDMLKLMNSAAYRSGVQSNQVISNLKLMLERSRDACELNKAKCVSVFSEIDALKEEFVDNINMLPYVNTCEQRQNDFCSGRNNEDKPGAMTSFFAKIATVCAPKDKNCNRKN